MSDEAHFLLNGDVNKQNNRYWGTENSLIIHKHVQFDQKVIIWYGRKSSDRTFLKTMTAKFSSPTVTVTELC